MPSSNTNTTTWSTVTHLSEEQRARIFRKCGMEDCARCGTWFTVEQRGEVWCPACRPAALRAVHTSAPARER